MIYQHRGQKFTWNQLLEAVFFATIVAAFVLLIPMKARAEEEKLQNRRGAERVGTHKLQTGERLLDGDELVLDKFRAVYDWSEQINSVIDTSLGDRE